MTMAGRNGSVDVNHHRGEVNINDQTGNVSLNLEGSSARLEHVKGDVTMQGNANEVDIEDVDGAVHLNGEFHESVRLVRVSKTVSFHSSRTDMEFSRLDGRLDLDSGDLRADSLAGPMRLTTRSKDIALDGLSGDLRLEDSNGTVSKSGCTSRGIFRSIIARETCRFRFLRIRRSRLKRARTKGRSTSDFDEIKVDNHDQQSSASGSIGENGPRLALNCEKGIDRDPQRDGGYRGAGSAPCPPSPARPGQSG